MSAQAQRLTEEQAAQLRELLCRLAGGRLPSRFAILVTSNDEHLSARPFTLLTNLPPLDIAPNECMLVSGSGDTASRHETPA